MHAFDFQIQESAVKTYGFYFSEHLISLSVGCCILMSIEGSWGYEKQQEVPDFSSRWEDAIVFQSGYLQKNPPKTKIFTLRDPSVLSMPDPQRNDCLSVLKSI